jgi:hypothetical protein
VSRYNYDFEEPRRSSNPVPATRRRATARVLEVVHPNSLETKGWRRRLTGFKPRESKIGRSKNGLSRRGSRVRVPLRSAKFPCRIMVLRSPKLSDNLACCAIRAALGCLRRWGGEHAADCQACKRTHAAAQLQCRGSMHAHSVGAHDAHPLWRIQSPPWRHSGRADAVGGFIAELLSARGYATTVRQGAPNDSRVF